MKQILLMTAICMMVGYLLGFIVGYCEGRTLAKTGHLLFGIKPKKGKQIKGIQSDDMESPDKNTHVCHG